MSRRRCAIRMPICAVVTIMSEVHQLPESDRIEREASEWIARLNADEVADTDRQHFEEWRNSHPMHARSYNELLTTWQAFTAAGPLVRAVSFGRSMNEATVPHSFKWRWLLAAAAVVVLGISLYWYTLDRVLDQVLQTAIGEHASISLSDGSTLELNSNTLARVSYSRSARVIHLDRGEAYFKVKHDTERPFWVMGGRWWVRAVGTEFDVYRRVGALRVTVTEGAVKISTAPVSLVSAGQQVDISASAAVMRALSASDLTRSAAWRSGSLYFESQPLGEVIDELSRYTATRMIVTDNALRLLPVGGTFQANSQGAEALLAMLQDGLGVRLRRDQGTVYISRAARN
jgi:transmembrane sensor